jgi:hypothetical protein
MGACQGKKQHQSISIRGPLREVPTAFPAMLQLHASDIYTVDLPAGIHQPGQHATQVGVLNGLSEGLEFMEHAGSQGTLPEP